MKDCYVYIRAEQVSEEEVKVIEVDTSEGKFHSIDFMFWCLKEEGFKRIFMADCIIQFSYLLEYCLQKNVEITNIIRQDENGAIYKMRIHGIDIISCDNIYRAPFEALCKEFNLGAPSAAAIEKLVTIIDDLGADRGFSFLNGDYLTIGSLAWKLLDSFSEVEDIMYKRYPMNHEQWKWLKKHNVYKGGLCLINKNFQGKDIEGLYKYDKNSFYSSVMKYGNMPKGTMSYHKGKPDTMKDVLVHAKISGIGAWIGLATFNDKEDFLDEDVYIWSDELEELTHWYDLTIDYIEYWTWSNCSPDPTFGKFVDYYFPQKKSANGLRRRGVKLILNNTNGKFGQKPDFYRYSIKDGKMRQGRRPAIDFNHIRSLAVASKITSLARTWLMRSIRQATNNRPDLYFVYGDTDSMILTIPFENIGDELGDFKFEGFFHKGVILNKKCYMLYNEKEGYECHACGVNRRALEDEIRTKDWNEARQIFNYNNEFFCPTAIKVKGGKIIKMIKRQLTDGTTVGNWNTVYGFFEGEQYGRE